MQRRPSDPYLEVSTSKPCAGEVDLAYAYFNSTLAERRGMDLDFVRLEAHRCRDGGSGRRRSPHFWFDVGECRSRT